VDERRVEPSLAVDTASAKFRGRFYLSVNGGNEFSVYNSADGTDKARGDYRAQFVRSDDQGRTWTAPRLVAPDGPARSYQYEPSLAVNAAGVVGVAWFDTRLNPGVTGYDLYFAASVDRGDTFAAPVRGGGRVVEAADGPLAPDGVGDVPLVARI
jgi:hypothetical protein